MHLNFDDKLIEIAKFVVKLMFLYIRSQCKGYL